MQNGLLISPTMLNYPLVNRYRESSKYLQLLSEWTQFTDGKLIAKLEEIQTSFKQLASIPVTGKIYRGFSDSAWLQKQTINTTGLAVGDVVEITLDWPLSCTTELGVAQKYGGNVISIDNGSVRDHVLYITDELAFLLAELRGAPEDLITEREAIILPSAGKIKVTVEQLDSSWKHW